jgi:putative ABC transport system permease protein
MTSIADQLARRYPKSNAGYGVVLVPMHEALASRIRPTLLLLLGAVGFVLVIACANVANLLLARSSARRRELAGRTALGAGRGRLVRQLLSESVTIGVAAGALGLLSASWGTRLVLAAIPDELPHTAQVALDARVLLFTLAVSLLTGIVFGIAPAFHSASIDPQESLKEGARTSGTGRRRAESTFIVVQIALAVVLLAGAALMIQSVSRLWRVDPGFDTSHVLTTQIDLSPAVAENPSRIRSTLRDTLARVAGVPEVRAAAISNVIPLRGDNVTVGFRAADGSQPAPSHRESSALWTIASPDYARTLGIPLLQGRFFTERDTKNSDPVVVIDEVMAKQLFPNGNAVGRAVFVNFPTYSKRRIVGVVGHIKEVSIDADNTAEIRAELYFPFAQVPDEFFPEAMSGLNLLVGTTTDPLGAVGAVRAAVSGPADDQPIYGIRSMEQIISRSLAERRFVMLLLVALSCTALVLAAIGIYGVMSYAVSRRTQELGVRAALGATRADVLKLVMRDGMTLSAMGLLAGVLAALGLTRLLANLLYGVQPTDALTLLAVSLAILGVAFLASYVPARRATKVDPMAALRYE